MAMESDLKYVFPRHVSFPPLVSSSRSEMRYLHPPRLDWSHLVLCAVFLSQVVKLLFLYCSSEICWGWCFHSFFLWLWRSLQEGVDGITLISEPLPARPFPSPSPSPSSSLPSSVQLFHLLALCVFVRTLLTPLYLGPTWIETCLGPRRDNQTHSQTAPVYSHQWSLSGPQQAISECLFLANPRTLLLPRMFLPSFLTSSWLKPLPSTYVHQFSSRILSTGCSTCSGRFWLFFRLSHLFFETFAAVVFGVFCVLPKITISTVLRCYTLWAGPGVLLAALLRRLSIGSVRCRLALSRFWGCSWWPPYQGPCLFYTSCRNSSWALPMWRAFCALYYFTFGFFCGAPCAWYFPGSHYVPCRAAIVSKILALPRFRSEGYYKTVDIPRNRHLGWVVQGPITLIEGSLRHC